MKQPSQLSFDVISKQNSNQSLLDSKGRQEMVELGGRLAQILGLPRSTGQIFGLLYLSPSPLPLGDICGQLGISKASTSTGTRQLATWGAVRKVWVPGERRDYYEAVEDFHQILNVSYITMIKPRIGSSKNRLNQIEDSLKKDMKLNFITEEQHNFMNKRISKVKKLHTKITKVLPILEKIFT